MSIEDLCIGCYCNDGGMCVCMTSCPKKKSLKKDENNEKKNGATS